MIMEILKDHLVSVVASACVTTMLVVMRNTISANLQEPFLPEMVVSLVLIALTYALVIELRKIKG